jgi:hypothetical protein
MVDYPNTEEDLPKTKIIKPELITVARERLWKHAYF